MEDKLRANANIALPPTSGGLPPHPPSSSAQLSVKREVSQLSPCGLDASMPDSSPANSRFSQDINRMPDYPQKKPGHRRAHSEIVTLPEDIGYGHFSMYMDMEKLITSPVTSGSGLTAGESSSASPSPNDYDSGGSTSEKPRVRHYHSFSMDGSTSIKPEMLTPPEPTLAEAKKATSAAKLADLALNDPKRAKRILANRQSAARSKERKVHYIAELERKVQTLQTEATTLSAQLTMLQRDTNGLTAENSELKLRLQAMEQQAHLQDALSDALREEVQRLKIMTGEIIPNGGQVMRFGSLFDTNLQYCHNPFAHSLLPTNQFEELQIHAQQQQQTAELRKKLAMEPSPTPVETSISNAATAE